MAYTAEQEAQARALLAKGDTLGTQASAQTGVQYNPTYSSYTPAAPISATAMNSNPQPVNVPQYAPPPPPSIDSIVNQAPSQEVTNAQNAQSDTMARIEALIGKQGTEAARQGELEMQAGIPGLQQNLNQITAQINGINASAFQATQNAEGRLAPTFAIYGEQALIERQKSAQTFGLAAAASAMQNNIALAQTNVERALKAEFGHIESQLNFLTNVKLSIDRDNLSAAESKQAQRIQYQLDERARLISEQKAEREGVYKLMTTLAQYGAPASIINQLQGASNFGDALRMAAPYMQDPMMKYDLQGAQLDLELKRLGLKTAQYNYGQLGKPSPTDTKALAAAQEAARQSLPTIQDKITQISGLISHSGLNSAVGTSALGRIGLADKVSGAKQDFIGGVQQLVSKDTIDTLLNLKKAGGTLGALSDGERAMLQSAASKIGTWAITKDGKVTGYNIDAGSFKRELETIRTLALRAQSQALGNAGYVGVDESTAITNFMSSNSTTPTTFSADNYW